MIEIFAGTNIGKREQQQDSFLVDNIIPDVMLDDCFFYQTKHNNAPVLVGVFDGLGGEMCGNIASSKAARMLYSEFSQWVGESEDLNIKEFFKNAVDTIHESVTDEFECAGIKGGTTLTATIIFQNQLFFINVGDSPAFLCHQKESIEEISLRQNRAGYLKSIGMPFSKSDESILLHCIGHDAIKNGISSVSNSLTLPFETGDCVILCSDGITNTISERELLKSSYKRDLIKAGRNLIKKAGDATNADNSTIIIIRKK